MKAPGPVNSLLLWFTGMFCSAIASAVAGVRNVAGWLAIGVKNSCEKAGEAEAKTMATASKESNLLILSVFNVNFLKISLCLNYVKTT